MLPNVTKCYTEIEIDIEKDIEIDNNIYRSTKSEIIDSKTALKNKIIDYLNEKANTNYKFTSKKTNNLIQARLNEGFSEEDFYKVIDNKVLEWKGTDFEKFLRPETLFSTKFESYLNQKVLITTDTISKIKGIDMSKFNF